MSVILVIGAKDGKCHQVVINEDQAAILHGMKLGDNLAGDNLGFAGYEFLITGGSDKCGFPMRSDLEGTQRRKILASKSLGIHIKRNGMRKRKNIFAEVFDVHEVW